MVTMLFVSCTLYLFPYLSLQLALNTVNSKIFVEKVYDFQQNIKGFQIIKSLTTK